MFPNFNFRFGQTKPVDTRDRFFKDLFQDPVQEESNPYDFSGGVEPEVSQPDNFMSVYKELMNRQNGPAMAAYRKFVEAPAPKREDFKPSKISRLGAILSGAAAGFQNPGAGIDIVQNMLDRPYHEGMRRYSEEGGRLREAAGLEQEEYKGKIASVKAIGEMQDKERDNARQDALASSLMKQRALTMEETKQRVEANGATFHLDKTSGIGYLVKRDGTSIPVKKFDLSTGEALDIDLKKMKTQSDLVGTRQVKLAGIQNAFSSKQQEDRQVHDKELESTRQTNRIKLSDDRIAAAAKRAAERVKAAPGSDVVLKRNIPLVQALIDAEPDKYEGMWDSESGALIDTPASDSPNYPAFVQLYNTLYKGITQLGAGRTTKGGNSAER